MKNKSRKAVCIYECVRMCVFGEGGGYGYKGLWGAERK